MAVCSSNTAKESETISTRTLKGISPKPSKTGRDCSRKKENNCKAIVAPATNQRQYVESLKTPSSTCMNLASTSDSRVLIESVIETLQQGEVLLTEISDENYTRNVPIA